MVANPRKTPGPGALRSIAPAITPEAVSHGTITPGAGSLQFRSLNLPVPIEVVENGAERPISITLPPARSSRMTQKGRSLTRSLMIASINDLWQVDDEWWRETPISRRYYQITTQDERRLTIFRDQLNGQWYWQKGGGEAVS